MTVLFLLLAAMLLASALGVVLSKSPVHCALSLFVNLIGVAAMYAMLHAHFLMVAQIIVYAGAVVVLVLFVIMLLNLRVEGARRPSTAMLACGVLAACIFLAIAVPVLRDAFANFSLHAKPVEGSVHDVGRLLFQRYFFLFQAAGVLLLASTVGAVMVARSVRKSKVSVEGPNASR